jgi:activator of HSP90 ATPase
VQSWRTSEFAEGDADSRLEVLLAPVKRGTNVTLRHSNIPAGQGASYKSGWVEHYFAPMKEYFGKKA